MGNTTTKAAPPPIGVAPASPSPQPPVANNTHQAANMSTDAPISPANPTHAPKPDTHVKCRAEIYPRQSVVKRFQTEDKVSWSLPYLEYEPQEYTAPNVACKPVWADKDYK